MIQFRNSKKLRTYGWEPDVVSAAALRLMPELASAKHGRCKVDVAGLQDRLLAACPQATKTLPASLGDHLITSIDRVEGDFKFIVRGRSGNDDPDATLRIVQLEAETLAAIAKRSHDQGKALRRGALRQSRSTSKNCLWPVEPKLLST